MKLGFIGCGNMAGAIVGGIIKNGVLEANDIIASNRTEVNRDKVKNTYGINVTASNREVVENADIVVLGVKPYFYEDVINEVKDYVKEDQIIVSIAPGKMISWFEEKFGKKVKIVRTMPNTPSLVCEGMTAVCANELVTEEELKEVCAVFEACGKVEVISEKLMDVVVSVSGSSPAYVFMFIEAMADAAVADGMPRQQAYKFAAQAVLGSAKMVLETEMHPGALKDMVCSPGGTTIEAVRVLEREGMRSAVIEAMKRCAEVAKGM